jgi:starch synthase
MCAPNAASLSDALARAVTLFADRPRYSAVQQRGMARDFSWKIASQGYEKLYAESL